ncbi:MAG: type II toxin-antitoxin system PemK/MazF family toxin [Bacteroidota bacterium]
MSGKQFEIWLADLSPRLGTEPGKTRPVVIVQIDILNKIHPSSIICPITTKVKAGVSILRINLKQGEANLKRDCAIMIDQLRAIDNKRLLRKIGTLKGERIQQIKENIKTVLDLD